MKFHLLVVAIGRFEVFFVCSILTVEMIPLTFLVSMVRQ